MNLTQHVMTSEQLAELNAKGIDVINVEPAEHVVANITFNDFPTYQELYKKAFVVAEIAQLNGANYALVGGAGYFMSALENALLERNIKPLHAFTLRESVEKIGENGEVIKTAVFKHKGFIGLND